MSTKNWTSSPILTVSILAVFVGLTTLGLTTGCSSPVISTTPQSNPVPTSAKVDTGKDGKDTEKVQVTLATSANKSQDLPLQKGMTYEEARQIILTQGWKPNPNLKANLRDPVVKAIFDRGYTEIEDCSGTGEAPCRYVFVNQNSELLYVVTAGRDRLLRNWWIDQKSDTQTNSTSGKIQSGRYWSSTTTQGIEVKGEVYRYYDEQAIDPSTAWQSIAALKLIGVDIISDGKNSWCLSGTCPTTGTDRVTNKRRPQIESKDRASDRLTDLLFYQLNPELKNRKLEPSDLGYTREWQRLRSAIAPRVQPSAEVCFPRSKEGEWEFGPINGESQTATYDYLADAVFYSRNPDMNGSIPANNQTAKNEWLAIRRVIYISNCGL
jgi:hypothetical protein